MVPVLPECSSRGHIAYSRGAAGGTQASPARQPGQQGVKDNLLSMMHEIFQEVMHFTQFFVMPCFGYT